MSTTIGASGESSDAARQSRRGRTTRPFASRGHRKLPGTPPSKRARSSFRSPATRSRLWPDRWRCFRVSVRFLRAAGGTRDQHKLLNQVTNGPAGLAALAGAHPADGQPAAVLTIPAVGVRQVVVEGTSAADLQSGPGLMPGTAPVGTLGDTVIAGRRSAYGAPFGSIGNLRPGDRITVVSALGTFQYRVTGTTLVRNAGQMAVGTQTSAARLELVTSATRFGGGGFLVVSAELLGTAVTAPSSSLPLPTTSELSLSGDPSAQVPSLLWGEALIVAILLTILAYRRSRLVDHHLRADDAAAHRPRPLLLRERGPAAAGNDLRLPIVVASDHPASVLGSSVPWAPAAAPIPPASHRRCRWRRPRRPVKLALAAVTLVAATCAACSSAGGTVTTTGRPASTTTTAGPASTTTTTRPPAASYVTVNGKRLQVPTERPGRPISPVKDVGQQIVM